MFRFVWQPENLSPQALDAARRAEFRIVCDLTGPQRLEKAALLTRLADPAMPIDFWIDGIGDSVEKYQKFASYVEALVAFHKFYGGKD